jgi:AcrR family transcriptional regulator
MSVSESMNRTPESRERLAPRDLRVPRSEETRRRLLEAGLALFAERGPHDVTSHAIAAHAGYASGTFYLHFKDKLELFRELAEEAASELENRVSSAAAGRSNPLELMQAQAEALVGFAEEHRNLIRIVFHPGGEAADIGSRILERLASGVSARRREAVAHGLARDCFDSDVLAQAIVGMWAHVLAWWAEDPSRASRDSIIRTLTHFQLHGNRAEPGALCGVPATETLSMSPAGTRAGRLPRTPPEGEPSR